MSADEILELNPEDLAICEQVKARGASCGYHATCESCGEVIHLAGIPNDVDVPIEWTVANIVEARDQLIGEHPLCQVCVQEVGFHPTAQERRLALVLFMLSHYNNFTDLPTPPPVDARQRDRRADPRGLGDAG